MDSLEDYQWQYIPGVEAALGLAHITVNKNAIPNDPQKPMVTSGIRVGTPALTTRGMKEKEMREIADIMDRALTAGIDGPELPKLRNRSLEISRAYPLYPELV